MIDTGSVRTTINALTRADAGAPVLVCGCTPIVSIGKKKKARTLGKNAAAPGFLWILLASSGEGLIHEREDLEDMANTSAMLTWADEYQLVLAPREEKPLGWTWRMTKDRVAIWRARIKRTVRRKNCDTQELRQILWNLRRCPGFRGIREDVSHLARYIDL